MKRVLQAGAITMLSFVALVPLLDALVQGSEKAPAPSALGDPADSPCAANGCRPGPPGKPGLPLQDGEGQAGKAPDADHPGKGKQGHKDKDKETEGEGGGRHGDGRGKGEDRGKESEEEDEGTGGGDEDGQDD